MEPVPFSNSSSHRAGGLSEERRSPWCPKVLDATDAYIEVSASSLVPWMRRVAAAHDGLPLCFPTRLRTCPQGQKGPRDFGGGRHPILDTRGIAAFHCGPMYQIRAVCQSFRPRLECCVAAKGSCFDLKSKLKYILVKFLNSTMLKLYCVKISASYFYR